MTRPARLAIAVGAGLSTLLWAGCAAKTQTAPAPGQDPALADSQAAATGEEFDPARFREDLLLIDPVFMPPTVAKAEAPTPATPPTQIVPHDGAAPAMASRPGYRVQVIALARVDGARRVAEELTRRFGVPVDVVPQGRLFAVHAGRFADAADAGELKGRIATLSQGYAGAFVVGDSLSVDPPVDAGAVDSADAGWAADVAAADMGGIDLPEPEVAFPGPELVPTQGWRVLIEQFSSLEAARDYRIRVMERLRRDDVDVTFETPWYRVLAGGFRSSTDAQAFLERCRSLGYRNAARVPGVVYLPKENQP